jgi:ergothioneine biosynthesis protein EgtB
VLALLQGPAGDRPDLLEAIELGLRHEQQHQELILSDIKNLFSISPLAPAYTPAADTDQRSTPAMHAAARDVPFEEGIHSIGHEGDCFAFDHERPRHRVFIEPFTLSDRLVTAGQWAAFIDDHGYTRPELWLAQREAWSAPLYWRRAPDRDAWRIFTLTGEHDLAADDPVVHVSFFEADAFARWSGARLPTEHEWETAAGGSRADTHANLLEQQRWHTAPPNETGEQRLTQMYGDVWEWTRSDFAPYPGYRPPSGVLGEYNGKFMSGQYVLRGGCFATPSDHITRTYRNYYGPADRWCFAGVRLAKDAR